ncbi:MAG: glycosyltransferase [bacterium]|nr:glycosyltransferase [bacterium]
MKKKRKNLSLTVGLTTCYGDPSILETIRSIRASKNVGEFPIILIADRVPLTSYIKKELRKYRVTFIENKSKGSQIKKQKQIIPLVKTDLFILTQDDVLLDKDSLGKVVDTFQKNEKTTMVSILNAPLPPQTHFEAVIGIGTDIANLQAKYWNSGDNFLSVIGRFMAFRTDTYKKFRLIESVATSDTYYYLENKRVGGMYKYVPEVAVNYVNPRNMKEHMRKSSRFQFSSDEMSKYFTGVASIYDVPRLVILRSLLENFVSKPLLTLEYLGVFAYTRLHKMKKSAVLNPIWEVDASTKVFTHTS